MSKYIDSLSEIHANTGGEVYRTEIAEILRYLDDHPELTGQTITESGVTEVFEASKSGRGGTRTALVRKGVTVVPDPEPTNAEKLETEIREMFQEPSQSFSIARDLAKKLDAAGWTKAPGGDHD